MTKTGCPSKAPNCAKGNLTCTAVGGVKKKVFYKRCGTQGKNCLPENQPPVLVLYFPTNGKASVALERTAIQPHGKRPAAYLQGCPFAWSFGVLNFF